MGRTHKQRRRARRAIRMQPTNQTKWRKPLSVVSVDRIGGGNPDNEFDRSDDWLEPYERTDEAL